MPRRGRSADGDAHGARRLAIDAIHPNRIGRQREHRAEFRRRCVGSNHAGQDDRHCRTSPDHIDARRVTVRENRRLQRLARRIRRKRRAGAEEAGHATRRTGAASSALPLSTTARDTTGTISATVSVSQPDAAHATNAASGSGAYTPAAAPTISARAGSAATFVMTPR